MARQICFPLHKTFDFYSSSFFWNEIDFFLISFEMKLFEMFEISLKLFVCRSMWWPCKLSYENIDRHIHTHTQTLFTVDGRAKFQSMMCTWFDNVQQPVADAQSQHHLCPISLDHHEMPYLLVFLLNFSLVFYSFFLHLSGISIFTFIHFNNTYRHKERA